MMIVKFGGHAMNDTQGLFAKSIKLALSKGQSVIVVHGGGPQINAELSKLQIEIAVDVLGGTGLNINADLAAAAISSAYPDSTLIIMTDVAGIYRNWPDQSSLIQDISVSDLESIKSSFSDGMLPKVEAVLEAIDAGAQSVRIIDGTNESSFDQALSGTGGTLVHA